MTAPKKSRKPLGEFATAQEAAQAKTEDLMKTLQNADLSFLRKNRS